MKPTALQQHACGVCSAWDALRASPTLAVTILDLDLNWLTNRQIGKLLFRSAKTIENHIGTINQKLHPSSRVQLALIAQHAGLEVSDAHVERVQAAADPGASIGR